MARPLRTAIVGFGAIADTLGDDQKMRRYFGAASHAEVLKSLSMFDVGAVLDPREEPRRRASLHWGVPNVFSTNTDFLEGYDPEVLVMTSPPGQRFELLKRCDNLKGVFLEKPLGDEASEIFRWSNERGIPVQVNYWRRAVAEFLFGQPKFVLREAGDIQAVFGIYGNGLRNNGSHLIDLARMLLGEVVSAHSLASPDFKRMPKLAGDSDIGFSLTFSTGIQMAVLPVNFDHYREVAIDIWGSKARVSVTQESLVVQSSPRMPNRGLENEHEIASDNYHSIQPSVRNSLSKLYENLFGAMSNGEPLLSGIASASATERVVDAVIKSAISDAKEISV